jgi:hypothetical protein
VISVRREQEAVVTIEPLLVCGIAPWLAVTGPQVLDAIDAGEAACALDQHDVVLELPLAPPREDERPSFGLTDIRVGLHALELVRFPLDDPDGRR